MLRYKYRIRQNIEREQIDMEGLYLSPDRTFISGTTSIKAKLANEDKVLINTITAIDSYTQKVETKNVWRQGYVIVNDNFQVETGKYWQKNGSGYSEVTVDYIKINDTYVYAVNGRYNVNGKTYDAYGGVVTVPTKHWIENGMFYTNDAWYEVDLNLETYEDEDNNTKYYSPNIYNEEGDIVTKINGALIEVYDYTPDKKEMVTRFIVRRENPSPIKTEDVSCARYELYAKVSDKTFPLTVIGEGQDKFIGADIGGVLYKISGQTTTSDGRIMDGDREVDEHMMPSSRYIIPVDSEAQDAIPLYSTVQSVPYGDKLVLFVEESEVIVPNDVIQAKPWNGEVYDLKIQTDAEGEFVIYGGARYNVEDNICDTVNVEGVDYVLYYTNTEKTSAVIQILGEEIQLSVSGNNATRVQKRLETVVGEDSGSDVVYQDQLYKYEVTQVSGVIIDGDRYPVITQIMSVPCGRTESGTTVYGDKEYQIIRIEKKEIYNFVVTDVFGGNMVVCEPILNNCYHLGVNEIKSIKQSICTMVNSNSENFSFELVDDIFGVGPIDYKTPFEILKGNTKGLTIKDSDQIIKFKQFMALFKVTDYTIIPLAIGQGTALNLFQDNNLSYLFEPNPIVDMERDVYSPKALSGDTDVYEIQFNLHFRTRQLPEWTVDEDNKDENGWFATDMKQYQDEEVNYYDDVQSHGDLLGFLNFSNGDVYYQKKKIAKSFLRISVYNEPNPNTQVLLHTGTMFLDEHMLFGRYTKGLVEQQYRMVSNNPPERLTTSIPTVLGEPLKYDRDYPNGIFSFDDNVRLECTFNALNKYESDTTSEGFYMYIFREYCRNLHDTVVYMKVEFNHAGVGRTIPFYLPMKPKKNPDELTYEGRMESAYCLSNEDDREEMLKGIPMQDYNLYSYIPVHLKFNKDTNQFMYYFAGPYAEAIEHEHKLTFNLFEIKFRDES